eukprot:gene1788-3894_t
MLLSSVAAAPAFAVGLKLVSFDTFGLISSNAVLEDSYKATVLTAATLLPTTYLTFTYWPAPHGLCVPMLVANAFASFFKYGPFTRRQAAVLGSLTFSCALSFTVGVLVESYFADTFVATLFELGAYTLILDT